MHADEIEYIFGHPLNSTLQYRQRERDLSRMMVQSVAKFARTGYVLHAYSAQLDFESFYSSKFIEFRCLSQVFRCLSQVFL